MKTIVIALTARPSYAKLKPLITELVGLGAPVVVLACASALLERYGRVVDQVRKDFPGLPIEEAWSTLEGSTLHTGAKDAGLLMIAVADILARLQPAMVVVMADRYETLSVTRAAFYQNFLVAHLQGGERSGNVDNKVRDANTTLATYHFSATERAYYRIYGITGNAETIWNYGCPSIDLAKVALASPAMTGPELWAHGVGSEIDPQRPFVLCLQHPETEHVNQAYDQLWSTYEALRAVSLPAVVFWPGQDAGSEQASKALRVAHNQYPSFPVRLIRSLPPERFLRLLSQAACCVGNSSAGIREASYLGTPVVNLGHRQEGRERAVNVLDRGWHLVESAIRQQVAHGPYPPSTLYGDGTAATRIARKLIELCGF